MQLFLRHLTLNYHSVSVIGLLFVVKHFRMFYVKNTLVTKNPDTYRGDYSTNSWLMVEWLSSNKALGK